MYPSSTSSSSQGSMGSGGLIRYGSAPGSIISAAVDSVVGATRDFSSLESQTHLGHSRFCASETSESTGMANQNDGPGREEQSKASTTIGLHTSFGFGSGSGASSSLFRHSSSPAGFLNQLAAAAGDRNGFSITRGLGSYNSKGMADQNAGGGLSRLNSQLSFTGKETLSRISEETENMATRCSIAINDNNNNNNNHNGQKKSAHSYAGTSGSTAAYGMGSWPEHNTNPMMFSVAQPSRGKNSVDALDNMETQLQFSISQTAQDMASMEKLLNIPQDSITCKIRAKRGCATHPRSIAERERRTRISGKLKKLQDLVPNMDKQTSYADMLDLAVQHIRTLQNEVQKLHRDLDNCTCGCKKNRDL